MAGPHHKDRDPSCSWLFGVRYVTFPKSANIMWPLFAPSLAGAGVVCTRELYKGNCVKQLCNWAARVGSAQETAQANCFRGWAGACFMGQRNA